MTIKGNSDPMWETNALLAIDTLAKIGRPFTAYDVAVVMESEPDHPGYEHQAARIRELEARVPTTS